MENMEMKTIIQKKIKPIDLDQLEKELDISKATLYRWINDTNTDSLKKYIKFLLLLGIEPKDVL